jgi:hypothetical protein
LVDDDYDRRNKHPLCSLLGAREAPSTALRRLFRKAKGQIELALDLQDKIDGTGDRTRRFCQRQSSESHELTRRLEETREARVSTLTLDPPPTSRRTIIGRPATTAPALAADPAHRRRLLEGESTSLLPQCGAVGSIASGRETRDVCFRPPQRKSHSDMTCTNSELSCTEPAPVPYPAIYSEYIHYGMMYGTVAGAVPRWL